jgi:hypothetical protein
MDFCRRVIAWIPGVQCGAHFDRGLGGELRELLVSFGERSLLFRADMSADQARSYPVSTN